MTIDKPGGSSGGGETLQGVQASSWVWGRLWKKEAAPSNMLRLNILDSITLTPRGVSNWLFTSSEGVIKRKSQANWSAPRILERISLMTAGGDKSMMKDGRVRAHYKFSHQNEWRHVRSADVEAMLSDAPGDGLIISYAHLKGSVAFVSQTYESASSCKKPLPQFQTFNLASMKAKGKKGSTEETFVDSALPTEKVVSFNKIFNEACKLFTQDIVKQLESKSKCTISKLSLVLALEDDPEQLQEDPDRTPNLEKNPKVLNAIKTGKTVWLHHVSEISFTNESNSNENRATSSESARGSERRSERDDDKKSVTRSQISHASSGFQRSNKCVGDFCTFNEVDILSSGRNTFDEDEISESIMKEIKDARRRYKLKNALKTEYVKALNTDRDPGSKLESNDPKESPSAKAKKEMEDNRDEPVLEDELSYIGEAQDEIGELQNVKSIARKVPYKSIILARQEFQIIDVNDMWNESCLWGRPMHSWWFRIGKSIHKGRGQVEAPLTSGYQIGQAVLSTKNLQLHTQNSGQADPNIPPVEASGEQQAMINDENIQNQLHLLPQPPQLVMKGPTFSQYASSEAGSNMYSDTSMASSSMPSKSIKGGMSKRCVGQLSWYYSDANVCEKCYAIYRNLDRRRTDREKLLMKDITNQQELINAKNKKFLEKQLDKKIFEQRKMVSRLLKPLEGSADVENNPENFDFVESLRRGQQQMMNKPKSHMSQMASMMSSISFDIGVGGGMMFNNNNFNDHHGNSNSNSNSKGFRSDVPKFAVPPVPWKLSDDEENRNKYINETGNSFIKNMKQKAEQVVQRASQLHNFERYVETSKYSSMEDLLFNNHQVTKNFGEHEQNWQQFTGQNVQQQELPKPKPKREKEKSKHSFNPDRLLHPWQRDMEKMKRERNQEEIAMQQKPAQSPPQYMDPISNSSKFSKQLPPLHGYMDSDQYNQLNQLNQGSIMSQITWDNSMAEGSIDEAMFLQPERPSKVTEKTSNEEEDQIIRLHEKFKKFEKLSSNNNNNNNNSNTSSSSSVMSSQIKSVKFADDNVSQVKSVKFELPLELDKDLSNKLSNIKSQLSPQKPKSATFEKKALPASKTHIARTNDDEGDDDGDDDDDDDEGIGWSPFVVSHPNPN